MGERDKGGGPQAGETEIRAVDPTPGRQRYGQWTPSRGDRDTGSDPMAGEREIRGGAQAGEREIQAVSYYNI